MRPPFLQPSGPPHARVPARARRWTPALAWLAILQLLGVPSAQAQDDEGGDEVGSRATRRDIEDDVERRPATLSFAYDLGLFGGAHAQTGDLGALAEVDLEATYARGHHQLELGVAYVYDPFATKSFNFTEDEAVDTPDRLVNWMHELGGEAAWEGDWRDWLATRLQVRSSYRWTELPADQRWLFEIDDEIFFGAAWNERGPYAEIGGEYFRRIYPNYRVSERSLDQQGAEGRFEAGYSFGRQAEVGLAYEIRRTDYLDARYDQRAPDGSIERADESKDYLRHALILDNVLRPTQRTRLGLRYTFQRNDSRHYDRDMSGRDDAGNLESRFIGDYYDYDRHWLRASARWRTPVGLDVELIGQYWIRLFDTYTARDVDNRWLDETRVDRQVEIGLETAYELYENGDHSIDLVAFVSHLSRRSNMQRQVSFATEYDVTTVFLGVEAQN